MTHDELVEELDRWIRFLHDNNKGKSWVKAIRSVVELHKPEQYEGRMGRFLICVYCIDEAGYQEVYPCGTIATIEQELR